MEYLLGKQQKIIKRWIAEKAQLTFGHDPGTRQGGFAWYGIKDKTFVWLNIDLLIVEERKWKCTPDFLLRRAKQFVKEWRPLFELTVQVAGENMEHKQANLDVRKFARYVLAFVPLYYPRALTREVQP